MLQPQQQHLALLSWQVHDALHHMHAHVTVLPWILAAGKVHAPAMSRLNVAHSDNCDLNRCIIRKAASILVY
jgi:hypothetical protein